MKITRVVAFLLAVFCVAGGAFAYFAAADNRLPVTETQVVVPQGATFSDIATVLAEHGVISNAFTFRVLGRVEHVDAEAHAGAYRFPAHQTQKDVLRALLTGGAQVAAWVTIPEGFTANEIAERMQQANAGDETALKNYFHAHHFEGELFPSTYLVPLGATPEQIARELTTEFKKQLPADASARAKALRVSVYQGVTVASLVEREAKADADRPMIAGVIYNRLKLRMPLQVDATIEYALPKHKSELSFADLKIDSPYNSYTHQGLPPTPIANPGRASLEAAFHPAKTDALYYVYCGNGHHVFAKTLSEHQANVARCLH